jgi:hypothetical protein
VLSAGHHAPIAKQSSRSVSAWFGDLGDGVHKGDENDPRVVLIDVTPTEVSYLDF